MQSSNHTTSWRTKTWLLILCAGLTLESFALADKSKPDLPKILNEVEKKYTQATTLSADFSQTNDNKTLGQKKINTGKIFVKRPSRIRWETKSPDTNLLVSNGKKFWFYTPPFEEGERGQLIEKKYSEVQSKLADALLSGSFSAVRDITVKQKSPSTFLIIPKSGTSGTVTQATIEINPKEKLIEKVTLDHLGGNRSEITLSQITLGPKLEDKLFEFQIPENTDRVQD